jgi:hypothetical protein
MNLKRKLTLTSFDLQTQRQLARRVWPYLVLAFSLWSLVPLGWAAPFAKHFKFTQPDGTQLTLWGEGDEFYATFETTAGYTVLFDPSQGAYFYADRAPNGKSFASTGVLAHESVPRGLLQHVRLDRSAVKAATQARKKQKDEATGLSKRWALLKAQTLGTPLPSGDDLPVLAPPQLPTVGNKVGLTLLIDFPDSPATLSQKEIDSFCNGDSYRGFGNNGSVKQYFSDVSGGRLTYSNVVTLYVRMTQPKTYYNDTSQNCGLLGRLLVDDALTILKQRADYNSDILTTFGGLT